jgi:hypothetical protein
LSPSDGRNERYDAFVQSVSEPALKERGMRSGIAMDTNQEIMPEQRQAAVLAMVPSDESCRAMQAEIPSSR